MISIKIQTGSLAANFIFFFFFSHYFFIYFLGRVLLSCRAIQLLYRQLEEFLPLSFSIYIIFFFPRPYSARVYSPGNLSSSGSPTAAHICYLYNTYISPPHPLQRKRRSAYRFPGEISRGVFFFVFKWIFTSFTSYIRPQRYDRKIDCTLIVITKSINYNNDNNSRNFRVVSAVGLFIGLNPIDRPDNCRYCGW